MLLVRLSILLMIVITKLIGGAAYAAINTPTGIPIAIGMYLPEVMQAKVDEKLNRELTQAEKVNLRLRLDSQIKVNN